MAVVINEFEVVPEQPAAREQPAAPGAGQERSEPTSKGERERQLEMTLQVRQARVVRRMAS